MDLTLQPNIQPLAHPITYKDGILLIGSCFTEHISDRLQQHKFNVLSNPDGILFNPLSVAHSLDSYLAKKQYTTNDLFYLNELWNSWHHHTRFSNIAQAAALEGINQSQQVAGTFIKHAGWVIITLGSAFQYYLKDKNLPVANNHRAPAQWFEKRLLSISEITAALKNTMEKLFSVNPHVQVLLTISPVRHIRDGVVDNNRSKARLIEATHTLCGQLDRVHYFPAYELIIDVLRDYRFYDIDFVHPNYLATTFVWEQFVKTCIDPSAKEVMEQVHEIMVARGHKARFPQTEAHQKFRQSHATKARELMHKYPYLDLKEELNYFLE